MKNEKNLVVGMDFVYAMIKSDVKFVVLTTQFRIFLLKAGEQSLFNLKFVPFPSSDGGLFTLEPGFVYELPF